MPPNQPGTEITQEEAWSEIAHVSEWMPLVNRQRTSNGLLHHQPSFPGPGCLGTDQMQSQRLLVQHVVREVASLEK